MLTNKDNLNHTVANLRIPFLSKLFFSLKKLFQLILRHCSQPLSSLLNCFLLTSLFKDITHIFFVSKIADTFSSYNIARPFSGDKLIKQTQVEWLTAVINECSNAILFSFTFLMVVIMMVVMLVTMLMFMLVFMMVVMMLMLVVIFFIMMMFIFFLPITLSFDFLYPTSRSSNSIPIKLFSIDDFIQIYITI